MTATNRILDWRGRQTEKNIRAACKRDRAGRVVMRDPASIVSVTLHQTACWYGVAPFQLQAAKGDEVLARHTRALAVHAHVTAMRHGKFVVAYPLELYVQHGHLLNGTDIGLEHEGLYDENGDPLEMPSGVNVGEIIEAGRAALTWIVEQAPTVRYLRAHRQSMRPGGKRRAKTSDPGARVFREVGVEHGVKKLGLSIEPDRVWGIGKPLPRSWYA